MEYSKRYVVILALLAVLGTSWAGQSNKTVKEESDKKEPRLGNNEYREAIVAFIKEIDKTYPFFDLKRIRQDWAIYKRQAFGRIESCSSDSEFYRLLDEARRCLRDAHIRFKDVKGAELQSKPHFYPGVSFHPAINKQVVIMSCPKEYMTEMPIGTIVSEIDGKNARRFLDRAAGESWAKGGYFSSPQRARLYAYRIPFQGQENDTHQITIMNDGKPQTITLVNKWKVRGWPHTYAMPQNLKRSGSCLYGKLESGHGYIYLRRIDSNLIKSIDVALRDFEGIKGLIVDLRGNGGGRYNREVFKRFNKKNGPSAGIPFYRGNMVVLIDAGTFSAGETLARDLVYSAGAYLMGSTTAGSSSAKRSWQLPHKLGTIILPTRSRRGFNRQPIEYKGITPHRTVEIVPDELQRGINSGIKRAEEYLSIKRH